MAGLLAGQGLLARPGRRGRKGRTRQGKGRWRAPDLVRRDFPAEAVNQSGTATALSSSPVRGSCISIRCWTWGHGGSGHALEEHHDAGLAVAALLMAAAVRGGQYRVIFHSDQGSEYTSAAFPAACARLGVVQSMGRPGSALDNAVIESWHSTLEWELRSLEKFATRAEARAAVAAWIEDYNAQRRHSSLGMLSPVAYERSVKGKDTT